MIDNILTCKEELVVYGASSGGQKVALMLKSFGLNISYFVDSDEKKWNTKVLDVLVKQPNYLCGRKVKIIIASDAGYTEIKRKLLSIGVGNQCILREELILPYIKEILETEISDVITIRPVLDLSNVRDGIASLSSVMTNAGSMSVSGGLADNISRSMNGRRKDTAEINSKNQNGSSNIKSGDNYYATFNITSDDPDEVAREVDTRLRRMHYQSAQAKGGRG